MQSLFTLIGSIPFGDILSGAEHIIAIATGLLIIWPNKKASGVLATSRQVVTVLSGAVGHNKAQKPTGDFQDTPRTAPPFPRNPR